MTQRLSFKPAPWAIGTAVILLLAPMPQVNAARLLEPDCQSFASWGARLCRVMSKRSPRCGRTHGDCRSPSAAGPQCTAYSADPPFHPQRRVD